MLPFNKTAPTPKRQVHLNLENKKEESGSWKEIIGKACTNLKSCEKVYGSSLVSLLSKEKAKLGKKKKPWTQQNLLFLGVSSSKGHFGLFIIQIFPKIQLLGNEIL